MKKPVKLNAKQIVATRVQVMKVKQAEEDLEMFIQGLFAGMDLEGPYNLDYGTWTLTPVKGK